MNSALPLFLADTWWYGLTRRLSQEQFERLARLRATQGFNAIQIVAGIPPEVGVYNPNAYSEAGLPWDLKGNLNSDYLRLARARIEMLNQLGLIAIVYGAWGHQIAWLGADKMREWWGRIIEYLDDLDVIYCITGESNLWIGREKLLLPDKSTDNLKTPTDNSLIFKVAQKTRFAGIWRRLRPLLVRSRDKIMLERNRGKRKEQWSQVLDFVHERTKKPILIHTNAGMLSHTSVNNPQLLAAVTTQTGHSLQKRADLWRIPAELYQKNPDIRYINLEPWYEGITGKFWKEDQLYAYWASVMCGAYAHCYGCHGIWNIGDGRFLSHWGGQTLDEAMALETPSLLGKSHEVFTTLRIHELRSITYQSLNGKLIEARREGREGQYAVYYPEMRIATEIVTGKYYLPLEGRFTESLPSAGQLVVIQI